MLFDIPEGLPIALERGNAAVAATVAESRKGERTWKLIIAVLSVHFLRFELDATSIAAAKAGAAIRMGIDLDAYRVESMTLAENTRAALALDLA